MASTGNLYHSWAARGVWLYAATDLEQMVPCTVYVAIPRNARNCTASFGVCSWLIAAIFSGSGLTPWQLNSRPKKRIFCFLMSHLSGLKTRPSCCATFMRLCKFASCSFSSFPNTATSSAIPMVHGQRSRMWSIRSWNTSWLKFNPKGRRSNR